MHVRLSFPATFCALLLFIATNLAEVVDPNGYLVYCPCMGRFGNQADQFLGVLAFARALNRTLILPAWVEYVYGQPRAKMVNFDRYFQVEPLQAYHRVILMETFMDQLAPTVWPPERRISFCWTARQGTSQDTCNSKDGNPFGPFWDHYRVDFVDSRFYASLGGHNVGEMPQLAARWTKTFPPEQYPVLAFTGAPAAFPVSAANRRLHRYLQWSTYIDDIADAFIKDTLPAGPFLGIHLRNDLDWDNVCKHVGEDEKPGRQLFASAQCLGQRGEHGVLTVELCKPSRDTILNQIRTKVQEIGAKSVFVAADKNHMIEDINRHLKDLKVRAFRQRVDEPHVSLALLAKADFYLGNCVSSFSAFAKRQRDYSPDGGRPSGFWAFPDDRQLEMKTEEKSVEGKVDKEREEL